MTATRLPVVDGQFYPGSPDQLQKAVNALIGGTAPTQYDAIGAVSPHAGYPYSGAVAARTIASLAPKDTFIIMGPNHTGMGGPFSVSPARSWKTPLGAVRTDAELADAITAGSRYAQYDEQAHLREHSVEVQLPFLQAHCPTAAIVALVISEATVDMYRALGSEIAAAITKTGKAGRVTIIASSDMTHYESQSSAREKDERAIAAIMKLDEAALIKTVVEYDISMCGSAPTAVMLSAAKILGARNAIRIDYRTSGDATGDYDAVVGYAGIIIT